MVTEPSDYFQEELVYGDDNTSLWALSPAFSPLDAFSRDLMMQEQEVEVQLLPPPVAHRSSFQSYSGREVRGLEYVAGSRNIHQRVMEMLRRIPMMRLEDEGGGSAGGGAETSRGFRHMMRERQRREKLSQNYADLYTMVSFRSKNEKNSIVQSASAYILELKGMKEALLRRNGELEAKILGSTNGEAKIKIRVANPHSAIDSVIGALRCLKNMNVKVKTMRFDLSKSEISATMCIDTKIGTADVERAVEGALMDVEKKLQCLFPGSNKYSQECHMQNVV